HAYDDALQVRAGMAMSALVEGDVDECQRILDEIAGQRTGPSFGAMMIESAAAAELALARGDLAAGLRLYLVAVEEMRDVRFAGMEPSGLEPWTLLAEAAGLMAHARHGRTPADVRTADELAVTTIERTVALLREQPMHLDYPVTGMSFAALAGWLLASDDPRRRRLGVDALALADGFSYNRTLPVMAWAPLAEAAERVASGRLAALREEYDGRPGRELLGEALDLLDEVAVLVRARAGSG
ncbi:MAG: transcriptional regulator, winged helix family, partial [Marmoricola sp.]|nr:transcriptional regulator, winged helix family [Marmoricola sp.]